MPRSDRSTEWIDRRSIRTRRNPLRCSAGRDRERLRAACRASGCKVVRSSKFTCRSMRVTGGRDQAATAPAFRSEEHTSELQSLMRISYAVFCLKKKKKQTNQNEIISSIRQHTKATKRRHHL